jgi:SNF2 family DNA or RNA helicase
VKKVFNQTASALAAITVLKKVCDHPALLSERAAHGIVSGASRARRQAAARLGGGGSGSSSDVEEIEGSSEEEGDSSEEEGDWESGGAGGGWRAFCCRQPGLCWG